MTPMIIIAVALAVSAADAGESRVERVVVFADRAEVTRVATAKCEQGAAAVVFAPLPESIDPRTLRGEAEGDAVAVGVSSASAPLVEALDERVRVLRKEITELDDQLLALRRAGADDAQRAHAVHSYGTYFRALAVEEMRAQKPDAGRWDTLLDFVSSSANAQLTTSVARAAEERTVARSRERLANRLARLSPAEAPGTRAATVSVTCGSQASPRVRISYVVPGASWSPEYDLRVSGATHEKATLTIAGVISQSSGEDWADAEIWLSTAKPLLGGEAPLPNPIWVNGAAEDKQKTLVQAQEERAQDLKGGKSTGGGAQSVELDDGGKAFVLKIPNKVTVRADGRPYWFPVDDVFAKASTTFVAMPALSPYVFEVAALNNPAPFPLMAGVVHVFRGATFVGNEALEYKAPGEPIELSLGVNEAITLERQDLLKSKREAGFFSGSQSVASAYRTILHNRSNADIFVTIREQVPVTKTADIDVKMDDKTTPGFKLDKVRGHLSWGMSIKKGATEKRDVAYTIKLPKEWALQ